MKILRKKGHSLESVTHIKDQGALLGLSVEIYQTGDVIPEGLTLRWGCTGSLPAGNEVLNMASCISNTSSKGSFRKLLAKNDLAPKVYEGSTLHGFFLPTQAFPVVVRPNFHSRGDGLLVPKNTEELKKAIEETGDPYVSELIEKAAEYRVFTLSGRVLAVLEKRPDDPSTVFWGCTEGGKFVYVNWDDWKEGLIEVALLSSELTGLDLCCLDIIQSKEGKFYTLENNTCPELTPYYAKCIAKGLKYIEENGRDPFDLPSSFDWKSSIHPAIWS